MVFEELLAIYSIKDKDETHLTTPCSHSLNLVRTIYTDVVAAAYPINF